MPRTVYLLVTIDLDDDDRTAEEVRAGIERDLSADQANVDLLADAHDAGTGTGITSGAADPAARERTAYLAAVITAILRHDPALEPYLSPICPECGQIPDADDGDHVVLGAAVVIGCEGYWVINPNTVGVAAPNWQPQE